MHPSKATICAMLYTWIQQRPGLEFGNYGDLSAYRSELRRITRQLHDARQLLRAVELSGISAEMLAESFRAFSGRLRLREDTRKPGRWILDYCTGQYWPTEYRAAACAVLASALWSYKRESCMPRVSYAVAGKGSYSTMMEAQEAANKYLPAIVSIEERYDGKTAGDWLRSKFRREFGRGIQGRWFD